MRRLLNGMILLILCFANSSYAEEPVNLKELHQAVIARGKKHRHRHSCSSAHFIPGPLGPTGPTGPQGTPGTPARGLAYGYASRTTGGVLGASMIVNYDNVSSANVNVVMNAATGIAIVQATGNYLIKFAISALQPNDSASSYELEVLVNGNSVGVFFTILPPDASASMSNSLEGQMIYALAAGDQVAIQNTVIPIPLFSIGSNITAYLSLEKIN